MSLPNLLPPLSEEEYTALKESLTKHGWWPEYPAVKDDQGNTLVGWHRLQIAEELGIEPVVVIKTGLSDWEKIEFAVKGDVARRHLTVEGRRELLAKLIEVHDEVLRQEGEEARRVGNTNGGKKSSLNETELRGAAAEATKTAFNGPVTVAPKEKKDRLKNYADMLGVSRATVARDEAAIKARLDRIAAIEEAAQAAGRDDIVEAVDRKNADLAGYEFELGLTREPEQSFSVPRPVEVRAEDRQAELDLLAAGLAAIHGKAFSAADARYVVQASGIPLNLLSVDMLNFFRAVKEAG